MSQKESEWEKEFDRAFASPSWSPAPMKKIFDELMQDGVKPFIRKTIANREKEIAEEVEGSVYAAFFSEAGEDDFEEYNNWRKNVLPGIILKH